MAKASPQELSERLFSSFLAPLVLGGTVIPNKPLGGKNALSIGDLATPSDPDVLSQVTLARVRIARRLAAVDTLRPAPCGSEWALAAMLNDLVQATHPGFNAAFRRSSPKRILTIINETLARIPPPANVGEALSRHTWLSRMFEITRTDVEVQWWTGHATFLGTDPPSRLLVWPEVRRVKQIRTPRTLMELPAHGSAIDAEVFMRAVYNFLRKTPLTDLATLTRPFPRFVWTHENLAFASTHAGRTLALRAFAGLPRETVDAALGLATKTLFSVRATRAVYTAIDVLRDRVLMLAVRPTSGTDPLRVEVDDDRAWTISAGAIAARHWIAMTEGGFGEDERREILRALEPAATSVTAKQIQTLLSA
ncbi:MAG: hypothetical protein FWD69_05995 [Polyangiaceae bacterium]|nr:hypothetical protein [Polyangiaceae bacterium]